MKAGVSLRGMTIIHIREDTSNASNQKKALKKKIKVYNYIASTMKKVVSFIGSHLHVPSIHTLLIIITIILLGSDGFSYSNTMCTVDS